MKYVDFFEHVLTFGCNLQRCCRRRHGDGNELSLARTKNQSDHLASSSRIVAQTSQRSSVDLDTRSNVSFTDP